jgi:hypothetical protein
MSKKSKTSTFLLELPLQVSAHQAKQLRAHFEAARGLYNALLGEAMKRLKLMRADPGWQQARNIPKAEKQERFALFSQLRQEYGFSEYALHAYATSARTAWLADHIDSNTAQKLATRAYQAANRVCLERKLDRQRRANNPQNYDHKGRVKKGRLRWKDSRGYKATRRRLSSQDRKLAAHRKSLHGRLVHEVVACGNTIKTEKLSYKVWQKQYGKSVGTMFIELLKRTVARTGGILHEVPPRCTRLSQYCHGCDSYAKKKRSERWHECACGIGPVQRDLSSAFLACYLDLRTFVPSIAPASWESAETRLQAAMEDVVQRANAGEALPQSMGMPRARARLPQSPASDHQELRYRHDRVEAVVRWQEPPAFYAGESQVLTSFPLPS